MTKTLFRDDAYLSVAEASVTALTDDGGIIHDQNNFNATSGGQPGAKGIFERADGTKIAIAGAVTGETKADIIHWQQMADFFQ